ncbi:hypothetical protein VIN01S_17750 [Vibrio inusitatus NBRC 102082]|uniref:DUF3080 domain-containing protein n=1 Tax=Vibrio inusitatus NBRC 102082 TaxID=1219070 RepID=A0A4Y3HVG4_9VIBR|nr:DUF3080 family protein [Vibrio inusitatus]GEA50971.1 hypothetical protein VIN01S_17750 [Vibrio inusitatus NBRC 102082]
MTEAKYAIIIGACLGLLGCDQAPNVENRFENYLNRLANVQQKNAIEVVIPTPDYPRKRELFQQTSRQTVGVVDALQLSKCNLMELVAQRNTVLGKVQDQFRNLEYEIALLSGLKSCLDTNKLSATLNEDLQNIYSIKWQELPLHITNTLYSSDAFYANLFSTDWYTKETNQGLYSLQNVLQQLSMLDALYHKGELPSYFDILSFQEEIEKYDQLGRISHSLQSATVYLQATTQQLQQYDNIIFCGNNRDTTKYRRLKNVFHKYYIGEIQPYLADLNSAYHTLSPHIEILYTVNLDNQYHHPVQSAYNKYTQATISHAQYWMILFKRCGDQVGQSS